MAYDSKCYELAATFLSDEEELDTDATRAALAQDIQTLIEDYIAGLRAECVCGWSSVNSASIDPPHRVVNKHCPIHGNFAARDPDAALEAKRDHERDFPWWEEEA